MSSIGQRGWIAESNFYYLVPDRSGHGVLFSIDFFVSLYLCLYLCLFVFLLERLRENGWTDLHEIFRESAEWSWDDLIQFRVKSVKPRADTRRKLIIGFFFNVANFLSAKTYNQTVNDGVAHSKNPKKCAYHGTFDLDLDLEHTLEARDDLESIVCKFGGNRAIVCEKKRFAQKFTDRRTDVGRRAIALAHSWNELTRSSAIAGWLTVRRESMPRIPEMDVEMTT